MIKRILILAIFLVPIVEGAIIQGTVYDIGIEPQKNVVIEIDTTPNQKVISRDGYYSLVVPMGNYTLKASLFENNALVASAEEKIEVKDDGVYNLDLVLFPSFEDEDELFEDIDDLTIIEDVFSPAIAIPWILVFILIGVIIFALLFKKKKKQKVLLEDDLDKLLRILKEKGGRATQKEIRKEFGLSEAKVSLMVTDLESQGLIRKIKKGRANIIILIKK
ncbi:MAG: winged helix-turn-helix transcriptional regulator [Nanoarchaeota archaeon]